jgi:hypothetical protein
VRLERPLLAGVERAEQIGTGVVGEALMVARGHVVASSGVRARRSFSSPSRMRPFTVPTG